MLAAIALSAALNAVTLPGSALKIINQPPIPMDTATDYSVVGKDNKRETLFILYPNGTYMCIKDVSQEALGSMMQTGPEYLAAYYALCGTRLP